MASKESLTDKSLRARLAQMMALVTADGLDAAGRLRFYDSDRMADWVNRHPGVVLWLRETDGEPRYGWRAYGAWALAGANDSFLADEQPRIEASGRQGPRQLSVLETLVELRDMLRRPGQAVRLVGLSGTGKTRLVQSLFEAELGEQPLPAHLAIYADAGEDLQPPPVEMLRRLAAHGGPSVLVIDNCNPATHRALQTTLAGRPGQVALLTIEYDIEGGEAEETAVYRLGAGMPDLLERLLQMRWSGLDSGVRRQVVQLSDGNLRVALALASAAKRTGALRGLSDGDLFERLFWQRRHPDSSLEHAAQVLALVYSFNVDESQVPEGATELDRLARVAGCTVAELRRHLATLLRRGLAQRRGPWRAILPHALANHLAARGLQAVSADDLWRELRQHERLSLSFARRLSALHESVEAQALVERWFREAPGIAIFNEHSMQGREVFRRLTPVRPDLALARLEELTAVEGQGLLGDVWIPCRDDALRISKHLAYPAADFARAAEVLVRLAVREASGDAGRTVPSIARPLETLFRPLSSGTEATPSQRLDLLGALLDSPDPGRRHLGLDALRIMLSVRWSGSVPETFGARVRGPGWQPSTPGEWESWYADVLDFIAVRLASSVEQGMALADLLSRALPGLVYSTRLEAPLESFVAALRGRAGARPLWQGLAVALLQAPRHADEPGANARVEMLRRLEALIRPTTPNEHLEALMLASPHGPLDVLAQERFEQHRSGGPEATGPHAQALARLASELAMKLREQGAPLGWLMSLRSPHAAALGEHLANAVDDLQACWKLLKDSFRHADPYQRTSGLLLGFFSAIHRQDGALAETVVAEVAFDTELLELGIELHAVHVVTEAGARRLIAIARSGAVAAERFGVLMFARVLDGLTPASHAQLLRAIAALPNGVRVAVGLHRMRLHGLGSRNAEIDDEACELCAELLLEVDASLDNESDWYSVSDLVPSALCCLRGREVAEHLCAVLIARHNGGFLDGVAEVVVGQLFAGQPLVALDAFGPGADDEEEEPRRDWWLMDDRHEHPLRQVSDAVLLAWAVVDAERRGPWLAARIKVFAAEPEQGFSPLARALLRQTHDRRRILDAFESGAIPSSWAGSYATVAQPFIVRLNALLSADEPDVAEWAHAQLQRIEERIAHWDLKERQGAHSFE